MRKNLAKLLALYVTGTMMMTVPAQTVFAKEASTAKEQTTAEGEETTKKPETEDKKSDKQAAETEIEEDGSTEMASAGISVLLSNYYSQNKNSKKKILKLLKPEEKTEKEEEKQTTQHEQYFQKLGIAVVDSYVNVRAEAGTEAEIVGKVYGNCGVTILDTVDGWYHIQSGNVTGYVSSDYFITGEKAEQYALEMGYVLAVVNADALNLRDGKSTDANKVGSLVMGSTYVVLEMSDGWARLAVDEYTEGWVSMDYISVQAVLETAVTPEEEAEKAEEAEKETETEPQTEPETTTEQNTTAEQNTTTEPQTEPVTQAPTEQNTTSGNGVSGSDIVSYAEKFVGNPYVYGGSSLTNGTDCSGFTMSVYAHFGYYLNRSSRTQISNGKEVSLNSLQPGDLVFYAPSGTISHVAIYIGGGQIVHASSPSTGIMISSVNYGDTPYAARRIIN